MSLFALLLLGACERAEEQTGSVDLPRGFDPMKAETLPSNEVFKVVEEMPEFPGCEDVADAVAHKRCVDQKLLEFVYGNIEYPEEAQRAGVEGLVVVSFVVEKDGSLSDIKVERDIGSGCGEAVVKVIEKMPRWHPGKQRGQPVRVRFNLPVRFHLDDS